MSISEPASQMAISMTMLMTILKTLIVKMKLISIYLEKAPKGKTTFMPGIFFQINVNGSLQSWLDDDNIIVNAILTESFRCVIDGPSEFGKHSY